MDSILELKARPEQGVLFENAAPGDSENSSREIRGNDGRFLRERNRPTFQSNRVMYSVDLFCGAGGFSLGAEEAARSLRIDLRVGYASDIDESAARCFEANFNGATVQRDDLAQVFDASHGRRLSGEEARISRSLGGVDLLIGGPPCQGHSDLNNYSRRSDPKNALYLVMSRAAHVLRPNHVLIENVPGAAHDKGRAFHQTVEDLQVLGYTVSWGIVEAITFGIPQRRRRLILLGSLTKVLDVKAIESMYALPPRDIRWAIEDLQDEPPSTRISEPADTSPANRARIDYLFDNDLWDLPNEQRPDCHRSGGHSYKSVYGRLRWDRASQTITSGFYSVCMGRYVHPSKRRTLTAHEAARLQFFPDFFDFSLTTKRTALAQIIGNAVPAKLSYPFVRELLKD